jgi:hypothetical protein
MPSDVVERVRRRLTSPVIQDPEAFHTWFAEQGRHKMAKGPRRTFSPFKSVAPQPVAGTSFEDFIIYASYRKSSAGFWGTLKVVRTTDKRTLFPFDGCPEFGPFFDAEQAVAAA